MKKSFILTMLLWTVTLMGAAQPKFASKVKKGIFSVNTYDKNGNLLRQGKGFYVGDNGEAVADYRLFKNAYKAVAVDAAGKSVGVDRCFSR